MVRRARQYMVGMVPQIPPLPSSREVRLPIQSPLKGMFLNRSIDESPVSSCRKAQNVRFEKGVLARIPGATKFGTALDGAVMLIDQYYKWDGTQYLLAITPESLYYWSSAGDDWILDETGFSGQEIYLPTSEVIDDVFVWTNSVDAIKRWTGPGSTEDQVTVLPSGVTVSFTSRYLLSFAGRLIIGNTREDGNEFPQRIRWSVLNNGRDFDGAGSGYTDFDDNPDWIVGVSTIGDQVVVYKERSVYVGRLTGDSTNPFAWRVVDEGVGPAVPASIIEYSRRHWWFGWDSIYEFTISGSKEIAAQIREHIYDVVTPASYDRGWALLVEEKSENWIFVPTRGGSIPTEAWVHNYVEDAWSTIKLPSGLYATRGGYYNREGGLTFGELTGTIGEQTWRFGESPLLEAAPINLVGCSSGQVYQLNELISGWDSQALEAVWESQTITHRDENGTLIDFIVKGVRIAYYPTQNDAILTVEVSTDEGSTWPYSVNLTLAGGTGVGIEHATAHFWVHTSAFRFRIKSVSATETFRIKDFILILCPSGDPLT